LIGYFLLLIGAGLSLWQTDVFSRVGIVWSVCGVVVSVGLGVLLAVTSRKHSSA
jgi:hypothetical protein